MFHNIYISLVSKLNFQAERVPKYSSRIFTTTPKSLKYVICTDVLTIIPQNNSPQNNIPQLLSAVIEKIPPLSPNLTKLVKFAPFLRFGATSNKI